MSSRILVLDANILIRAVLGDRVRNLIIKNYKQVNFFTPDVCLADAEKYLPILFEKRSLPADQSLKVLSGLSNLIQIMDAKIYNQYAQEAKRRMENRDLNDWPIAASALSLNSPIWTEDRDFFGSGFTTWVTDKIHIFFEEK